jgi:hypothetical protein
MQHSSFALSKRYAVCIGGREMPKPSCIRKCEQRDAMYSIALVLLTPETIDNPTAEKGLTTRQSLECSSSERQTLSQIIMIAMTSDSP